MIKKTVTLLFITSACWAAPQPTGDLLIDEIKAIVDGPSSTEILTLTDIERRAFDGQTHKIDELIRECAGKQHSVELGITVEDEDIVRYLRAVAQEQHQENSITPETLKATAAQAGFATVEEFYDVLKRMYGANAAMNMEVSSLAAVSEQEARAYDQANVIYKPATYIVQTSFVPRDESMSADQQKEQLLANKTLSWSVAFDIAEPDIAPEKQFIKTLKPNEVHVDAVAQGFELYRLKHSVAQQRVSFEDRKKEILAKLREEKFNKAITRYHQDRLDEVQVTTF